MEAGLNCEIWDEKRLEEERMGALLAVGRGSATSPRLIHLSYVPKKAKRKIVFVTAMYTIVTDLYMICPVNLTFDVGVGITLN